MYSTPTIQNVNMTTDTAMCCELGVSQLSGFRNPLFCDAQTCGEEVRIGNMWGEVPMPCNINFTE